MILEFRYTVLVKIDTSISRREGNVKRDLQGSTDALLKAANPGSSIEQKQRQKNDNIGFHQRSYRDDIALGGRSKCPK